MANITITKVAGRGRLAQVCWFLALWLAGVGGTMLLALPFKLLIRAGAGG
ncbi:hypothetical protein AWB81_00662 [Caballeronia arationis]|jgi:hypothetical protein|uniref:Uncharacterized protein n=1 Tax=Caballeronia arationis TaxID=1777142 RepID=A0A7Z7I3Q9_9BURK|nr:hypothetical protein AWB81_00662 [Caballeronia arationis]SOE59658.1 hypothetical protein SAMN05446927_1800 [Caballeronia arationis]